VRQQHPELFTEAIVLHARQGDRGCPSPTRADLILKGSAVVPHRCGRNTSLICGDLRACAGRISADEGLALLAAAARTPELPVAEIAM